MQFCFRSSDVQFLLSSSLLAIVVDVAKPYQKGAFFVFLENILPSIFYINYWESEGSVLKLSESLSNYFSCYNGGKTA